MKLLVYTPSINNRVGYAIDTFLRTFVGVDYAISSDIKQFNVYDGPKLNYSEQMMPGIISIVPHKLLFEKGVNTFTITDGTWNGCKTLFPNTDNTFVPFDPFAATFYLISRYEEYLPSPPDRHGRFRPGFSLAHRLGFLGEPIVDKWAVLVKQQLQELYPALVFTPRQYKFIATYDIDVAFAYYGRSWKRLLGAYGRDLAKLNISQLVERVLVLSGLKKDPYNTYQYQLDLQQQYGFEQHYFFLNGNYGKFDKNVNPETCPQLKKIIRDLSNSFTIGIHPSYSSNYNNFNLSKEIERLEKITKTDIHTSRQHYLKMKLPQTYRHLIDCGIRSDYTMGYASRIGFRSGTCTPHYFYDLIANESTNLMLYPFQVMDGTLKDYMELTPEEAFDKVKPIIDAVKEVNGTFISLWHNQSLAEDKKWKGWNKMYEQMLAYASSPKNPT